MTKSTASIVCIAFVLTACSSLPETRYFVLTPSPDGQVVPQNDIIIESVQLPTYLNQSGIVLATRPHQMVHARSYRWAEPLDEGIERTLQTGLERRLEHRQVAGRVELDVRHFHGDHSGQVTLDADWRITMADRTVHAGRFFDTDHQSTSGYEAMVAMQAELIQRLATQIGDTIEAHTSDANES